MAEPILDPELAAGLLVLGAGLVVAAVPGLFATIDETVDAVGSTRTDVEPTRWRVELTRLGGLAVAAVGAWYLLWELGVVGGFPG